MEGATHFIEQWQGKSGDTYTGNVNPISILESSLEFTELVDGLHTVCIFKIKLKKP